MEYSVEQYSPALREQWDAFVRASRNGTFLFLRDYMDYHADRFRDCSLVARNGKGKIVALLPANADGETLKSHAGLTFGGWIGGYRDFDVISLLNIQQEADSFLTAQGFRKLLYKPVPYIYSNGPSQEDLYMLFAGVGSPGPADRCGAGRGNAAQNAPGCRGRTAGGRVG